MEQYNCVKCNHNQYEAGEFHATGGTLTKLFDIQNQKFTTITCQQCFYTDIYKADSSTLGNILDFFVGG
jgi:predicted nucleic-acid-binding Zn-ribbon protein